MLWYTKTHIKKSSQMLGLILLSETAHQEGKYIVCSLWLCLNLGVQPAPDQTFYLRSTVEKMVAFMAFKEIRL